MRRVFGALTKPYAFILLSAAGVACFDVVDIAYFETIGYSLAFIGLMTAAFNFAVSAAELPFAMVFDRYSNKLALQIGNILRIGAFALFFFNLSEGSLILAQVLAGVAVAAMSGTSNDLVVNEIEQLSVDKATSAFGRIAYLSAGAGIVGGLIGILLFHIRPELIWAGAIVFFLAAGVVIATFTDTRARTEHVPWRVYGRDVVRTVTTRHAWILVLTNAAAVAPYILWQIKFNIVSVLFILAGYLGMQVASLLGPILLRVWRVNTAHLWILAALNVVAAVTFGLSVSPVFVWITFVLHVLLHGMLQIVAVGLYHAQIPNRIRATAGSIISMADSLVVAVVAPLVALLGQHYGLSWAIMISAGIYAVIAVGGARRRVRCAVVEVG